MMKFIFVFLFLLLNPFNSISQNILKGRVTETLYNYSLEDIKIVIGNKNVYTDKNGNFEIQTKLPIKIKIAPII